MTERREWWLIVERGGWSAYPNEKRIGVPFPCGAKCTKTRTPDAVHVREVLPGDEDLRHALDVFTADANRLLKENNALVEAARAVVRVYRSPVGNLHRRMDFTEVVKDLVAALPEETDHE